MNATVNKSCDEKKSGRLLGPRGDLRELTRRDYVLTVVEPNKKVKSLHPKSLVTGI
jgi:hypothetical protein